MAGHEGARARLVPILSLVLATLFWAGNFVVGAAAIQAIDPLSLVLLRWGLAAIPLLVIAQVAERPNWRGVLAAWPWLIALSLVGVLGYALLMYAALQFTTPLNGAIINSFSPAVIALAAVVVLRARLTPRGILGVVIALVGVLFVVSKGDLGALLQLGLGPGELLMIGAVSAWAGYTILGRLAPQVPPIASTGVQAVIATLALLPFSLASGGPELPQTGGVWGALACIVIFPSVLSYLLWNRALTVIPPERAGVFMNLIAVFTAIYTIASGGAYTAVQIIGGVVVIAGVILANAPAKRRGAGRG